MHTPRLLLAVLGGSLLLGCGRSSSSSRAPLGSAGTLAAPVASAGVAAAASAAAAPVASAGVAAASSAGLGAGLGPAFSRVGRFTVTLSGGAEADVYHPDPPDLGQNPTYAFPGAVLLQGAQVTKDSYQLLAGALAGHGFVVVVPNHRHPLMGGWYPHVGLVVEVRDWLQAERARSTPLGRSLDPGKLAALGHSYGGLTALRALAGDNGLPTGWPGFQRPAELACAVVFATKTSLIGTPAPVANGGRPVCLIQGELDQKTRLDEAWETLRRVEEAPTALVTVLGAGHFLAADVDDPPGAVPDPATPTLPQQDAVATAARWAAWFLRAHLLGDRAAWEAVYLPEAHPEPGVLVAARAPLPAGVQFTRHVVAAGQSVAGPAYATPADLDRDGRPELVVSSFGRFGIPIPPGQVTVFRRVGGLGDWRPEAALPASAGVLFPNAVTARDVDGDGDLDLVVPAGFLASEAVPLIGGPSGRLLWLESDAGRWVRRDVTPVGPLFFHRALFTDLDGDGTDDLLTVGERKPLLGASESKALWFRGDPAAPSRFEASGRELAAGLGSFPSLHDVDGDGDLDLISAEFFVPGGSWAWLERPAGPPTGPWRRHTIGGGSGPAIQLALVPDLFGDGVLRAVGSNHVDRDAREPAEVVALTPGPDPRAPWSRRLLSRGIRARPGAPWAPQAAPGVFAAGDLDGDGDQDLVVSGDGDPDVFWLEQVRPGDFLTHVLVRELPQAGVSLHDLDGDGRLEVILTGYEADQVLILSR